MSELPYPRSVTIDTVVNGRSPLEGVLSTKSPTDAAYERCPESHPGRDVPRSTVIERHDAFRRDLWISVPAGPVTSPGIIVFKDGALYLDEDGPVAAVAVLDSLMACGELGPTVGVFVNPGRDRSLEYDSTDDTYGRFLVRELLPFVETELGTALTTDPRRRWLCGMSSGGVAAFVAAWHHPSAFGGVISHCGSFVDIRGADQIATWVRLSPRRPIKVHLQTGTADLRVPQGNWRLANEVLADALDYAGYDCQLDVGVGGHSLEHAGATFADTLRWLASPEDHARTEAEDAAILAETRKLAGLTPR